jgi:hypothetical protein
MDWEGEIRGQMVITFCERNGFYITNTWFKRPGQHREIKIDIS